MLLIAYLANFFIVKINVCAYDALMRFYATIIESSVMLCIKIQRNIM